MFKFLKKSFIPKILISTTLLLFAGVIVSTVSWFSTIMEIDPPVNKQTSGILTSYFDSGSGTQNDPYVITRPKHFYHMSYLQNRNYFGNNEVYFQFGKKNIDNQENTDFLFYEYNSDGTIVPNKYVHTLNMDYYNGQNGNQALMPIGNSQYPFKSHVNGCNNTISNIHIDGNGLSDIGIFGYVSASATINNVYFDNVSIDTHLPISSDTYHSHTDNRYNVGYLAGHICDEISFHRAFVNNCEITNSSIPGVAGKSLYGLFGACDTSSTPLTNTEVDEYQINPGTVHSYMDSNYSKFSAKAAAARNTEYAGQLSSTAFSSAFSKNGSNYDLQGTSSGASYNYSLSTIGHQGMDTSFDLSYGNSHQDVLATTTVIPDGVDIADVSDPGTYMYFNSTTSKWQYYVITSGGQTVTKTFNVFSLSYSFNDQTYYVYYDTSTSSLKSDTTVPTISNKNYWFCFKTSLTTSDLGVESFASVGSSGRYYIYVPVADKYIYITNSNVFNVGSATKVSSLEGTGNTGSFSIDSVDSAITWVGRYNSANATFAFQGGESSVSIVRPVNGNEATTFAFNGTSKRTETSTTASEEFQLITDVSQITNNMKVGIGYPALDGSNKYYLMSTIQQTNNRDVVITTLKSGTTLNGVSGAVKLTVSISAVEGGSLYSLYDPNYNDGEGGYLYAASSSKNYLRTKTSESYWTISINDASPYNAVLTSQENVTHDLMRFNYNNGNPLFACYASGQEPICLYKYYQTGGVLITAECGELSVTTSSGGEPTKTAYVAYYDNDHSDLHDYQELEFERSRITWDFVNSVITVAPLSESYWKKITNVGDATGGDYLIVCESASVAFNGGLNTLDAADNNISVSISADRIPYDSTTESAKFTYNPTNSTLKSASGYYIGKTATGNGLNTSTSVQYTNSISFDGSDAVITGSGGPVLRYNNSANNNRFRYYGSGQQPIQLYKLVSESNDPEYIADAISELDNKYNYNKIDVVGNASFTASSISLTSNLANTKAVSKWHADNSNDGINAKFYQTKYVGNSIVFFIPNQGSSDFGTLHFSCTSASAPVFVKGTDSNRAGWESSIGFSDERIQCANDSSSANTYDYTLSLNKNNILNLSYAALNSSGNIVACYDTDGAKVLPSLNVSFNSISTFVLAISTPSANLNATTINLKINHIEGDIATLSYVGYRSATYLSGTTTIDDEEVNVVNDTTSIIKNHDVFYRYDSTSANNRIYEKMEVSYDPDTKKFTYEITFRATISITLYLFNFDAERAEVSINGVPYKESYHAVPIPATAW